MIEPDHDLSTTDGVVAHLTERIRAIVERQDGIPHPESIRAAKEQAHAELLAELFSRVEAFERVCKRCPTCQALIREDERFCSLQCGFKDRFDSQSES